MKAEDTSHKPSFCCILRCKLLNRERAESFIRSGMTCGACCCCERKFRLIAFTLP